MPELRFVCPECAETVSVDEGMKAALIEAGCVICGAEVTDDDFERR